VSVYAITGELGTGKSLLCVSKIRDALLDGRRVATNLDLRLEHLVGPKRARDVLRVPDFPGRADLDALGLGCEEYDEKRFGLLVLDEAATFLNARDFRDAGRGDVIKWLLHSRKLHWDVFLIIQDLGMLDKQVRTAFVEHVVRCKRSDRLSVPLVSGLASALGLGRVKFPRVHYAIVRYGTSQHAIVVDRWVFSGRGLYRAYDTGQKLIGREVAPGVLATSLHSVLCPARASWLRPLSRRERLYGFLRGLGERYPRLGSLARLLPPVSAAEVSRRLWLLSERGVDLSYNPAHVSFSEWDRARAGRPGALGGRKPGEAREPEPLEGARYSAYQDRGGEFSR